MEIEKMRDREKEYSMQEVEERLYETKLEIGTIKCDLEKFKKGRKFTLSNKLFIAAVGSCVLQIIIDPTLGWFAWTLCLLVINVQPFIIPKYKAYFLSAEKELKLDHLYQEKEQLKELSKHLEKEAGTLMQKMGQLDDHGMQVMKCIIEEYVNKDIDADTISNITQFLIETGPCSIPVEETQLGQNKLLKKKDHPFYRGML